MVYRARRDSFVVAVVMMAGPVLAIVLSNPAVPDVTLFYRNLREVVTDLGDARTYGGIHFRFDNEAGARQGRRVASYILRHHLRPLRRDGSRSTSASDPEGMP